VKLDLANLKHSQNSHRLSEVANISNLDQEASAEVRGVILTGSSNKKDANYVIKSSNAAQISTNQFTLKSIDITYKDANFEQIKIFADNGLFDNMRKHISLQHKIAVLTQGYLLNSDILEMDLDNSIIKANTVELRHIDSKINSDSCVIHNNSKSFRCHGKVKADIHFSGF
jgi:hypothetical protein